MKSLPAPSGTVLPDVCRSACLCPVSLQEKPSTKVIHFLANLECQGHVFERSSFPFKMHEGLTIFSRVDFYNCIWGNKSFVYFYFFSFYVWFLPSVTPFRYLFCIALGSSTHIFLSLVPYSNLQYVCVY